MALDWSKEISFSGLRKRGPKAPSNYPSKTYMNLAVSDRNAVEARRAVPVALLLVVLVALFAKFGVYDFVDQVSKKQAGLSQQQQVLSGYQAQLADYNTVLQEYQSYEASNLSSGSPVIGSLDALRLVDEVVAPAASIASVDYQSGVITLSLAGISLDGVGNLVSSLYDRPEVLNVNVSTAANGQASSDQTTAAMVITLQGAGSDAR